MTRYWNNGAWKRYKRVRRLIFEKEYKLVLERAELHFTEDIRGSCSSLKILEIVVLKKN